MTSLAFDPPGECSLCERLVAFRQQNKARHPGFFNQPVPNFGDPKARILIVGLAPGLKGANQTGRPFTGDYAGDLLYDCLLARGLATGRYDRRPDDGLALQSVMITNAVRCVPPQNKPNGSEINTCRRYLDATLAALPRLRLLFALGRIAHDTLLRHFGLRLADYRFCHGGLHRLPNGLMLADSYHCSRYNVNTGRLTRDMFLAALDGALAALDRGSDRA